MFSVDLLSLPPPTAVNKRAAASRGDRLPSPAGLTLRFSTDFVYAGGVYHYVRRDLLAGIWAMQLKSLRLSPEPRRD